MNYKAEPQPIKTNLSSKTQNVSTVQYGLSPSQSEQKKSAVAKLCLTYYQNIAKLWLILEFLYWVNTPSPRNAKFVYRTNIFYKQIRDLVETTKWKGKKLTGILRVMETWVKSDVPVSLLKSLIWSTYPDSLWLYLTFSCSDVWRFI